MKELDEALLNLRTAQGRYDGAKLALDEARSEETSALNALNEAQKRFDQVTELVRKDPQWGSDWHRRKNPGVPA